MLGADDPLFLDPTGYLPGTPVEIPGASVDVRVRGGACDATVQDTRVHGGNAFGHAAPPSRFARQHAVAGPPRSSAVSPLRAQSRCACCDELPAGTSQQAIARQSAGKGFIRVGRMLQWHIKGVGKEYAWNGSV